MRKLLLGCLLLLGMAASAQQQEPVKTNYDEWRMLGESSDHIDVSARVRKCGGTNQVHLFIFNESSSDQTSKFELEIINDSDSKSFKKEVTFSSKRTEMYQGQCDSKTDLDALKIDLPVGYDPSNLTIKIAFKN